MRNPVFIVIDWLERQRRFQTLREVRGKLLDIGCKYNWLVQSYRAQGGAGTGIDVHDFGGADMVLEDTAHLPFEDQAFDTITFVACLNHIPNRAEVLREAARVLASDGRLIATMLTPGISQFWHWLVRDYDDDQTKRGMRAGEVIGLSVREMKQLFTAAGLEVVCHRRFVWGLNHLYVAQKKRASAQLPQP